MFKAVLTFESVDKTIQSKATKQYFPLALLIMLHKMALPFEPVVEILKCDHANESY